MKDIFLVFLPFYNKAAKKSNNTLTPEFLAIFSQGTQNLSHASTNQKDTDEER